MTESSKKTGFTWLREPLLHFLVVGAILFALFAAVRTPEPETDSRRIVVSATDRAWLNATWEKQWGRQPTDDEKRGLVDSFVREEILYREALAMSLEQDDVIIRRRLATKMEFLAKDLADSQPPNEDDVRAWFDENTIQYQEPDQLSFVHIYVSPDQHEGAAVQFAADTAASLGARNLNEDELHTMGDPIMLERQFSQQSKEDLRRTFGEDFADALFDIEPGTWQGPIESGYGLHVVRVLEREMAPPPELDAVRDRVYMDIVSARRKEADAALMEAMRERYEIVYEDEAL
jgi:hypothetical protein